MKKVELGGKKRPVRFSYLCIKDICKTTKLGLNQLSSLGSEIDHVGIMAYFGLKHGASKNGEEFNYKISFKVFSKQITLSFKVNSKE